MESESVDKNITHLKKRRNKRGGQKKEIKALFRNKTPKKSETEREEIERLQNSYENIVSSGQLN